MLCRTAALTGPRSPSAALPSRQISRTIESGPSAPAPIHSPGQEVGFGERQNARHGPLMPEGLISFTRVQEEARLAMPSIRLFCCVVAPLYLRGRPDGAGISLGCLKVSGVLLQIMRMSVDAKADGFPDRSARRNASALADDKASGCRCIDDEAIIRPRGTRRDSRHDTIYDRRSAMFNDRHEIAAGNASVMYSQRRLCNRNVRHAQERDR